MAKDKKYQAYRFGLFAETAAILWLWCKGYYILARRYRNPHGEIDIIAKRGRTIAFIEVKARHSRAAAAESLSPFQRQRIARAAEAFHQSKSKYAGLDARFDLMLIAPWKTPHHLKDAWRL